MMKAKRIFFFFFSFILLSVSAQKKNDAVKTKWKYTPNFYVGVDLLNAGLAPFSDRKLLQGFISSEITKRWYGIVDVGFEKNIYEKNAYNVEAMGPFVKLGALYMLVNDQDNIKNGFLAGGKLAGSFYRQEFKAIPVRGFGGNATSESFPYSQQSSYWIEVSLGGRVQLFETPFYIEVTAQPKYLLASTLQEDIKPMIVPGFGKSSSKFNMGFSWNIVYYF